MDKLRVIKVFEDTPIKLKLKEQEINDILSIRNIIGDKNLILQADGKLLISHYVGFVQINNTRVLIYPKIARNVQGEDFYNKSFDVLVKMLTYTGFDSVKRLNIPINSRRFEGDVLELLIGIFVDELLSLFKRDINRNYNPIIENESFIKGKIDFAENIKKNSYRKHLHSLKYEQFTENILMNQIFKTVILNLIKKTVIKENRMKLGQALLWLEDVEQIKVTSNIWDKFAFTRLNQRYYTVFNMARLFYYNSSINLNKGDEVTFSFLVPLNQLFERYVFQMLNESMEPDLSIKYQGPINYLGYMDDKRILPLKPDITIIKNDQVLMILEAKYKEVIDSEGKIDISPSDIYQMLAYSVKYKCDRIVLIYPEMMGCMREKIELQTIEIPKENDVLNIRVVLVNLENDKNLVMRQLAEYISAFLN